MTRPTVSIIVRVPPGTPEPERERLCREAWGAHIHAALLEGRCPKCYARLVDEYGERPDWSGRCSDHPVVHGWWRREPVRHGEGGGHEWEIGGDIRDHPAWRPW